MDWREETQNRILRQEREYHDRMWKRHIEKIWKQVQQHIESANRRYNWQELKITVDEFDRDEIILLLRQRYNYIVTYGKHANEIIVYSRKSPRPHYGGSA